jgi:hypothetical protein
MFDWEGQFAIDFGPTVSSSARRRKPSVIPWYAWYLQHLRLPSDGTRIHALQAEEFGLQARSTLRSALGDAMSTVAELVLDADVETAEYQIGRLQGRYESTYRVCEERAILHYAVLTGSVRMVGALLERGCTVLINQQDSVTGQTPLHLALFMGSREIMRLLASHAECNPALRDNYRGTMMDYARMLDYLPPLASLTTKSISLRDASPATVRVVSVEDFEQLFGVRFTNATLCDLRYVFELSFSALSMETRDDAFREASGCDESVC